MAIDYSARAKGRAMYLPAGQSGTHNMAYRADLPSRPEGLPACLNSLRDLDFMDRGNPLFFYNRGLFSAGQFLDRAGANLPKGVFSRRAGNTILTDSGGLQFGRMKKVWEGDKSREWTLRFAEANGDEAIGLDIPTEAIENGHPLFNTVDACLAVTLDNNAYWMKHRRADTRFLAVIQGRTFKEARAWLEGIVAVPMEGWSFGGDMKSDYLWLAEALQNLRGQGLLGPDRNRVHVLGDSSLTQAVMLSALQKSMRELLGDDQFLITFDTSTPSEMVKNGDAYRYARMDKASFTIPPFKPPSLHDNAGTDTPFPVLSSAIAERMKVSDLCVPSSARQHGWDTLGNELLINHNIESLLRGIDEANSALELPRGWQDEFAPPHVILAYNALRTMHEYPRDPLGHLRQSAASFAKL